MEMAEDSTGDRCRFGCQETLDPVVQKLSSNDSGFEAEFCAARSRWAFCLT